MLLRASGLLDKLEWALGYQTSFTSKCVDHGHAGRKSIWKDSGFWCVIATVLLTPLNAHTL